MENQKHIEAYQGLFNYLHEHGLILVQSEMDQIIKLSEKVKLKYNKATQLNRAKLASVQVNWIDENGDEHNHHFTKATLEEAKVLLDLITSK